MEATRAKKKEKTKKMAAGLVLSLNKEPVANFLSRIKVSLDRGDPLTNKDLLRGITLYSELGEMLSGMGPEFHLAWREVFQRTIQMRDWLKARDLGRKHGKTNLAGAGMEKY